MDYFEMKDVITKEAVRKIIDSEYPAKYVGIERKVNDLLVRSIINAVLEDITFEIGDNGVSANYCKAEAILKCGKNINIEFYL